MLKQMGFLIPLFYLFGLNGCTQSKENQVIEVIIDSETFEKYEKVEFDIKLKGEWTDPYISSDIALDMILTSPSGREITMPGFYVKGNSGEVSQWAVRFMAQETGEYEYYMRLHQEGTVIEETSPFVFESVPSERKGILKKNNLWTFRYDNGELFRGIGENICWEARTNDDNKYLKELHEKPRFNYEYLLTSLSENGGNFFRTWMIFWNLPVDWKIVHNTDRYENSDSRFNESAIERMDEVVELCDSLDIHFMLALEAHGGFMGDGWDRNSYNVKQGGPAKTPYEFFSLDESREMYKDKLRFMTARWGYSPAIGAFEFFNEVDNVMYNVPEEDHLPEKLIRDWHEEMSRYLKEIDPFGHLVTTSVSHRDVEGMNDIPHIDFNQKHIYRGTNSIPETLREYSEKYEKPYVIGEFGYEWDWNVDFYEIADQKTGDYKRGLWYGLFSPTPVLPMSWWWEFFDEMGVRDYLRHVKVINELMLEKGEDFRQIQIAIAESEIINYAVQVGDTYFVYLYNPLEENVNTSIALPYLSQKDVKIEKYHCETSMFDHVSAFDISSGELIVSELEIPGGLDYVLIIN